MGKRIVESDEKLNNRLCRLSSPQETASWELICMCQLPVLVNEHNHTGDDKFIQVKSWVSRLSQRERGCRTTELTPYYITAHSLQLHNTMLR